MCSWAVNRIRRVCAEMSSYADGRNISPDALESFSLSLELVYRELLIQQTLTNGSTNASGSSDDSNLLEMCDMIRRALATIQEMYDLQLISMEYSSVPVECTGAVGRPRFDIPREQIISLIESKFTIPQIADITGVSIRTIHRRMAEYGLTIRSMYSEMTDQELDTIVSDIHKEFPMCGNRQMSGHLLSCGFRIQQQRIRESMRRVDPEGSLMRRLNVINRRNYCVPAPRSLYHIDGNHKLIRYVLDQ